MNIPKPKKKRFYKKWWFWLLAIFLFLIISGIGLGYYGYTQFKNAIPQALEEYTVVKKDLVKTVSLEGVIQSKKQADLYFTTSGKVTEVNVKIGDNVDTDKVLAKIDADGFATTKQQELKAPFGGVITEVNINVDELVNLQTLALKVESVDTEIKATASEQEIVDLKPGLSAEITFDSYPNILLTGAVTSVAERKESAGASLGVSTSTSTDTSGYRLKLDYDKPADLVIKRDVSCTVEIKVAEKKQVLAIPLAAVKWENDEPYVELNTSLGAEKRSITLGFEGDEDIEVTSGLEAQDKLILFSAADVLNTGGMF